MKPHINMSPKQNVNFSALHQPKTPLVQAPIWCGHCFCGGEHRSTAYCNWWISGRWGINWFSKRSAFIFFKIEDVEKGALILLLPMGLLEVAVFGSVVGLGCYLVVVTAQPVRSGFRRGNFVCSGLPSKGAIFRALGFVFVGFLGVF